MSSRKSRRHPRRVRKVVGDIVNTFARPVDRFLRVEAASGIVLGVATLIALLWANVPNSTYDAVWSVDLGVRNSAFEFVRPLHFWINDVLMTLFFFGVGVEVQSEIRGGELSTLRKAALPLIAALGGMVMPAFLYAVINSAGGVARGWGVPMATDIAFAVGVLTLIGKRVSPQARVLLLALAVIDDIGAIIVIALFYSAHVALQWLLLVVAGALAILYARKRGLKTAYLYLLPGVCMWIGLFKAGIHPTIAGVLLGLAMPARATEGSESASASVNVPFSEYFFANLHSVVAFAVMPLFALSNAGVNLGGAVDAISSSVPVVLGIVAGLVVGKPLGIVMAVALAVKLRAVDLPKDIGLREVVVIGAVAGIGFTMAIFIAQLAFVTDNLLRVSKLAILGASLLAATLAVTAGRVLLQPRQ